MFLRSSAGALALLAPLALRPLAAQRLSAVQRDYLAASLWSAARTSYAGWDRVTANWDSGFAAELGLASPPQPDVVWYHRLCRFVALLNDGAAALVPPPALRSRIARPPLLLASVEGRPFILDYAENDEMRVARPERLAEIVTVQGIPAAEWIRDSVLPEIGAATPAARWDRAVAAMLQGAKGTALQLRLRLPSGEERGISVTRSVSLADRWPLTPPALTVDSLPDGVVLMRITSFAERDVVQRFDRALAGLWAAPGLILDLREAAGGRRDYAYQILARLISQPSPAVLRRTPEYRPGLRALGEPDSAVGWYALPLDSIAPREPVPGYGGPVAVLSSNRTSGAAEDFLAAFRNAGRGVIVGDTSAGSPGDVLAVPLAVPIVKDWSLELTVTRDAFPDGTEFTGTGIAPEFPIGETVTDFLAGRDAALERARAYVTARAP